MNHEHLRFMLRETLYERNVHEAPRLGAALAFYTILSLAPLVTLAIAIAAFIFGRSTAQHQLLASWEHDWPAALKGMVEHAQEPACGTFASIIGIVTLLFGASGVFGELRSALKQDVGR